MDYIDALNFFIYGNQMRVLEEARLREQQLLLEAAHAEHLLREASARAKQRLFKERLAAERLARDAAKLARLAAMRAAKLGKQDAPKIKRRKSQMQTRGVGKTHPSKCHHSREEMNMTFRFPNITTGVVGNHNNSMVVQIETLNRPMIMESVSMKPFTDADYANEPLAGFARPIKTPIRSIISNSANKRIDARRLAFDIGSPLRPETITTLRANTTGSNMIGEEEFDALMRPDSIQKYFPLPESARQENDALRQRAKTITILRATTQSDNEVEINVETLSNRGRHDQNTSDTLFLPNQSNKQDVFEESDPRMLVANARDFSNRAVHLPKDSNDVSVLASLYDEDRYKRWELTATPGNQKMRDDRLRQSDTAQTITMEDLDFIRSGQLSSASRKTNVRNGGKERATNDDLDFIRGGLSSSSKKAQDYKIQTKAIEDVDWIRGGQSAPSRGLLSRSFFMPHLTRVEK